MYNMDKLYQAVADRGPVCIGLDTTVDYIPLGAVERANSPAEAIVAYNSAIIEATWDIAACYKVQIAFYEALGLEGLRAYAETIRYIRSRGALVIADIKRGDIAISAERYVQAHFSGDFEADFVTLSPFMGMDTLEPWLTVAASSGKGAFVLVRTSNPGMRDFEYQELKSGRRFYEAVGDSLQALAERYMGAHGYGLFGAVVGAEPKSLEERLEILQLRKKYDTLFFLSPGYGAQGGGAEDAALLLRDGNGGVINASRSILTAWSGQLASEGKPLLEANLDFAASSARNAALAMQKSLLGAVKAGGVQRGG